MSAVQTRRILRGGHIVASGLLGTYLYSPWSSDPVFSAIVLFIAFPAMAVSGLWMWNQGRINRWLKGEPA